MSFVGILHLVCVAFMAGLIWLIQLVHYPLMSMVAVDQFQAFHSAHSFRITWIVAPVMALELLSGALLLFQASEADRGWAGLCFGLTFFVFGVTAFYSVPAHGVLAGGFDEKAHIRLVSTNWLRTIAWSLHLGLCIWLVSAQRVLNGAHETQ